MHNYRHAPGIGIIYIHSESLSGFPYSYHIQEWLSLPFSLAIENFSKEKFRWRILGTRKVVPATNRTYLKSLWWPNGKRGTHLKTLLPGYKARERISSRLAEHLPILSPFCIVFKIPPFTLPKLISWFYENHRIVCCYECWCYNLSINANYY